MFFGLGPPAAWRIAAAGVLIVWAWLGSPPRSFAGPRAEPHLYVLLGFANMSPGLREFGAKMQKRGIPTTVGSYTDWEELTKQANREYKSGHAILIVGHSAGGAAARAMAVRLGEAGIPVRLLVTLAPWTKLKVSSNVRKSVNIVPTGYENHFTVIRAHERELTRYVMAAVGRRNAADKDKMRHAAQ
jgi:alpha-beta hydrolase superfamily lysophospholipase